MERWVCFACIAACNTEPLELGTTTDDIQGSITYVGCSTDDVAFIDRAMYMGRIASESAAFRGCLEDKLAGYWSCSDDPASFRAATATLADRVTALVTAAQSDNRITIHCDGDNSFQAAAWATSIHTVTSTQAEEFTYRRGWLDAQKTSLTAHPRVCGPNELPGANCHVRNEPYSQIASVAWHESQHNHGFGHDQDGSEGGGSHECMTGDPPVNLEHSVPYIVGQCIEGVLWSGGHSCGDLAWCGTSGLQIPDAWGSTTCACVEESGPACYDPVDSDGDSRGDRCDACPAIANEPPTDGDHDGKPDVCDNCPASSNTSQTDTDHDGKGNVCDNCPWIANANQSDGDRDNVGDVCDNCPNAWNEWQHDRDGDGLGDVCDPDSDGDGILDAVDLCPTLASTNNNDADHDHVGDPCDGCDLVRGLAWDCKPLNQQMRIFLDDRLEAIAEELKKLGIGGPYGPWGPFLQCAWMCDESTTRHAARVAAVDAWVAANKNKPVTDAVIRQLLLGEEGATVEAVDRFLKDRLARF